MEAKTLFWLIIIACCALIVARNRIQNILVEKLLLKIKNGTYIKSIICIGLILIIYVGCKDAEYKNSIEKGYTHNSDQQAQPSASTPYMTGTKKEYEKKTQKEYIKGSDTIHITGSSSDSYDLYTNRELNKSEIQLLKNALTYMGLNIDYTSFLYTKGKQGENYYAYFNGVSIFPKVTKEILNDNLLSDLKSGITITSKGSIILFLDKIEKAKTAINSNTTNKEEIKKVLSQFQKIYFAKARKAYYQNAKEELWEKDIEVELSGRNITFIGYHFSTNKVIKDTYLEIKDELTKLRFKTVGFKAFDGDDKTYWELDAKNDSEI